MKKNLLFVLFALTLFICIPSAKAVTAPVTMNQKSSYTLSNSIGEKRTIYVYNTNKGEPSFQISLDLLGPSDTNSAKTYNCDNAGSPGLKEIAIIQYGKKNGYSDLVIQIALYFDAVALKKSNDSFFLNPLTLYFENKDATGDGKDQIIDPDGYVDKALELYFKSSEISYASKKSGYTGVYLELKCNNGTCSYPESGNVVLSSIEGLNIPNDAKIISVTATGGKIIALSLGNPSTTTFKIEATPQTSVCKNCAYVEVSIEYEHSSITAIPSYCAPYGTGNVVGTSSMLIYNATGTSKKIFTLSSGYSSTTDDLPFYKYQACGPTIIAEGGLDVGDNSSIKHFTDVKIDYSKIFGEQACDGTSYETNLANVGITTTDSSGNEITTASTKNKYCTVYCKEDFEIIIPSKTIAPENENSDIFTGRFFTLEDLEINGRKTCVTGIEDNESIDLAQFFKDMYGYEISESKEIITGPSVTKIINRRLGGLYWLYANATQLEKAYTTLSAQLSSPQHLTYNANYQAYENYTCSKTSSSQGECTERGLTYTDGKCSWSETCSRPVTCTYVIHADRYKISSAAGGGVPVDLNDISGFFGGLSGDRNGLEQRIWNATVGIVMAPVGSGLLPPVSNVWSGLDALGGASGYFTVFAINGVNYAMIFDKTVAASSNKSVCSSMASYEDIKGNQSIMQGTANDTDGNIGFIGGTRSKVGDIMDKGSFGNVGKVVHGGQQTIKIAKNIILKEMEQAIADISECTNFYKKVSYQVNPTVKFNYCDDYNIEYELKEVERNGKVEFCKSVPNIIDYTCDDIGASLNCEVGEDGKIGTCVSADDATVPASKVIDEKLYTTISYYKCANKGCTNGVLTTTRVPVTLGTKVEINRKFRANTITEYYAVQPTGVPRTTEIKDRSIKLGETGRVFPLSITNTKKVCDYSFIVTGIGENGRFEKCFPNMSKPFVCELKIAPDILTPCEGNGSCPDGGINFYYRAIDLKDVFPNSNTSANGKNLANSRTRNIGKNWASDKGQATEEAIEKAGEYIYTPDKTSGNYSLEYSYTLTAKQMQQVRIYNKRQEERGLGYTDFNLECDSTGQKCVSNFLNGELFNCTEQKCFTDNLAADPNNLSTRNVVFNLWEDGYSWKGGIVK